MMNLNPMNLFARKKSELKAPDKAAAAGLFNDQAVDSLVYMISRMPDLDEVLKKAGIRREKLRVLMFDDEISQAVETRCDALLSVPMRLEPSEGAEADLVREILKPVLRSAMTGAFQARLYGYSVLEAVYMRREDGKIGLKYLGEKPFEWFEPKNTGELRFFPNDGSGGWEGIEVDQRFKFFLTRSNPTYRTPQGEALLSRLYWPWFFRQNGWNFWSKFLERFGSPLLVGKSTDPQAMVDALLLAHSQAVIGVGREDSVEALGAGSGAKGDAFDLFESAVLRRIQKVVLGQTLTSGTDGGSGNRALGQVHNAVRLDKRDSDIQLVQETIQRVVDAICMLNNFKKMEVVFADETGLETDRSERDKNLYAIGVRFEPSYIEDNYGLSAEDFTLSSEAPVDGTPPNPADGGAANPANPGDAQPASNQRQPGAKASQTPPRSSTSFASGGQKFTKRQRIVEDLGDEALKDAGLPLGAKIRKAVLAATSPEDLEDRLFALIGTDVSTDDFRETLEKALFTADVLGYVHAEGKV